MDLVSTETYLVFAVGGVEFATVCKVHSWTYISHIDTIDAKFIGSLSCSDIRTSPQK
jgi:hypothetical protein